MYKVSDVRVISPLLFGVVVKHNRYCLHSYFIIMAAGAHLYLYRSFNGMPYIHHGIDCGDGTVIHYQGKLKNSAVTRVSLDHFMGETLHVKEYGKSDASEVVIQRAESRLGESGYNVFGNNCEHFAYWCKTGLSYSEQIRNMQVAATGLASVGMGAIAARVAAEGMRLGSGMLGLGGLVSGFTTDIVMGEILSDSEFLTDEERAIRQNARSAGQIATTVGSIAGGMTAGLIGGGLGLAAAVATPALLGVGIATGTYYLLQTQSNQNEELA